MGDAVLGAVVEGEDTIAFGFREPRFDERAQPFRLLGREVAAFGGIRAGVEQRPLVGREVVTPRRSRRVRRP